MKKHGGEVLAGERMLPDFQVQRQPFLNSAFTINNCSFYHQRDDSADTQMPVGCLHINLATQEALQFQSLEV